ncbi:hypothetical protein FALBO_11559 [Fusarium albosuccineum]|uniref:Uncharacterized protein n=1 Tax=Fusarium albosuccineum TaxID=1237068 RepID=A0A8H4P3Z3_9HYPO|nr:hypothetical protein FALBO_11559 [Fusarium albosuccineum]
MVYFFPRAACHCALFVPCNYTRTHEQGADAVAAFGLFWPMSHELVLVRLFPSYRAAVNWHETSDTRWNRKTEDERKISPLYPRHVNLGSVPTTTRWTDGRTRRMQMPGTRGVKCGYRDELARWEYGSGESTVAYGNVDCESPTGESMATSSVAGRVFPTSLLIPPLQPV